MAVTKAHDPKTALLVIDLQKGIILGLPTASNRQSSVKLAPADD